ncbi:MAG: type I-E CRISPR-associated protein Cse1/CasA [Syntrophorhabdaceae bacterium]|nr:type I-E CRISPR-associated protein Cse1/CasA [Syntrophorhabdaceae bacterium]
MNVAFNDWIPVLEGGRERLASIRDALSNEKIIDLAVLPHQRVAAMRLLMCVAHAALDGPKDYEEWEKARKRLPGAVQAYLSDHKDLFELFHPDFPWLQVKDLGGKDITPLSHLDFTLTKGGNPKVFNYQDIPDRPHADRPKAALDLITYLNFALQGAGPKARWQGKDTPVAGQPSGPCGPAIAHCFLRGRNLLETLCLNLVTHEEIERHGVGMGRPVWEQFPRSRGDKDAISNATGTYLGSLVPLTRLIRILPDGNGMYCGLGFIFRSLTEEEGKNVDGPQGGVVLLPTAAIVVEKAKNGGVEIRKYVTVDKNKALWRELPAIIVKRSSEKSDDGSVWALSNIPVDSPCDIHVCSFISEKGIKQKIHKIVESVFHVPAAVREHSGVYSDGVQNAERVAQALGGAIIKYCKSLSAKGKGLADRAGEFYWTLVEGSLPLLVAHIEAIGTDDFTPTGVTWRNSLTRAARDVYETMCGREGPGRLQAYMKGLKHLTKRIQQITGGIENVRVSE